MEESNDGRERILVKYMLLIYANQETWAGFGPEDWSKAIAEKDAFNKEFFDSGELLSAYGLADVVNTKVVRVRDGAASGDRRPVSGGQGTSGLLLRARLRR
jgi:hypothetical protein